MWLCSNSSFPTQLPVFVFSYHKKFGLKNDTRWPKVLGTFRMTEDEEEGSIRAKWKWDELECETWRCFCKSQRWLPTEGDNSLQGKRRKNEYTLRAYSVLSFNFQNDISTFMDKKVGLREFRLLSKVKLQKWVMESALNPLPSDSTIYLLFY